MNIFHIVKIHPYAPTGVGQQDWNHDRYAAVIHRMLRRLHGNPFGRIILNEINRLAGPDTKITLDPDDGYFRYGASTPNCVPGYGPEVTIYFLPAPWRSPDTILLHELVHAVGYLAFGKYDARKEWEFARLGPPFHTKGELLAMAVANLYRLDEHHTTLRVGYEDDTRWVAPRSATFEFAAVFEVFRDYATRINPGLARRLGVVVPRGYPAHRYNPFRWVRTPADIAGQRAGVRERARLDALFETPG